MLVLQAKHNFNNYSHNETTSNIVHSSPIIVIITSVINTYFLFPTNNNLRTYSPSILYDLCHSIIMNSAAHDTLLAT